MSIPLDRLYQYIENIAEDVRGDNVIIYRFFPHGSKKLADLTQLHYDYPRIKYEVCPHIICHDQEPLNYDLYNSRDSDMPLSHLEQQLVKAGIGLPPHENLRRHGLTNIYDKALLIHSERNSRNVERYRQNNFIPVYYWSHALIAQDWFRFAEYIQPVKNIKKTFLIYNRAWSGTREYRLKFSEFLIKAGLIEECQTNCNPVDSQLGIHYDLHNFSNPVWRPKTVIENYIPGTEATSNYSADFDIKDYNSTLIEVVLETLFDDSRIHLTEKSLRPIACGQPFILAAPAGSLEYLKSYGFKTYSSCWDESYDQLDHPVDRMLKILEVMNDITTAPEWSRNLAMEKAQEIARYNQQHFFSQEFTNQISEELRHNLFRAFSELEETNTSQNYLDFRKLVEENSVMQALNADAKEEFNLADQLARYYHSS